jgi:MFS family permease
MAPAPWVAMLVMLVFGAYAFGWGTLSSAVRQRAVPTAFQGRVTSVYNVGVFGGMVAGSALGGVIARQFLHHRAVLVRRRRLRRDPRGPLAPAQVAHAEEPAPERV